MNDRRSKRGTPRHMGRDYNGVQALRSLVDEIGLGYAWKALQPRQSGMTWTARGLESRIDRLYVSNTLVTSLQSAWVFPTALSDHSFLVFRFTDYGLAPRAKGCWCLNIKLLEDPRVVDEINDVIKTSLKSVPTATAWESFKAAVKVCFQTWGTKLARQECEEIRKVSDAILILSAPLSQGPSIAGALCELRKELHSLLNKRWDRLRATARAERWERETWCSRHLLRRRLATKGSALCAITDPATGITTTKPEEVTEAARLFYEQLYQRTQGTPRGFPLKSPEISPIVVDTPFDAEELSLALKAMKQNRSPGTDGLPPAFYTKFWPLLAKYFTALVNASLDEGELPVSQREGIITLLCKDETKASDLRAWRPITLLNSDYKIIAKSLSLRLTPALTDIVGTYQACCIPGRSAELHGLGLKDLLTWAASRDLPGYVCSLDQEKAFDKVSHEYLFQVLEQAGISKDFRKQIQCLYNGPTSAVLVQGRTSASFPIERGVRQGCPLSPLLYILAIEPLLQNIFSESGIRNFPLPVGPPCTPIFAYADDITVVVPDSDSVASLLNTVDLYCQASGASLNRAKSAIMSLLPELGSSGCLHGLPRNCMVCLAKKK